jgi:hypothetical protein
MLLVLIFILLFICESLYIKIANYFNIIDKPNFRSSHTQITIRGGGIIFWIATLFYFIYSGFSNPYFFIGLTLIVSISFLDDIFTISNIYRLIFQFISISLTLCQLSFQSHHYWLFIVILVDEQVTQISGCAIDKSVAFIKRVEQQLNIHFFDRMNVAYQKDNMIETCTMHEFQTLLNEGKVDDQTLVFNNLVSTKKEFDTNWKIPLQKSWHKRLLNTPAI